MNYDPNQFHQGPGHQGGYDPHGFGGFDPNAFDPNGMPHGMEFTTYTPRKKEPYWKRIGGGSLTLSVLVHVILILIAMFIIKFVVSSKKEEPVDFLPGGGGGGKSTQAKLASKRRAVTMSTPKSRIAANVANSAVTLPDVQSITTDTSMTGFAVPTAGGVGGGEGGLRGKGKGGLMGDGFGKGVGPGHGIGFVGRLPEIMQARCSPQERTAKMRANGGNDDCEKAVIKALAWLKTKQNPDGSWGNAWKCGMTGLALLAYYGHCETPDSLIYGDTIMKGIQYLQNVSQKKGGYFSEVLGSNHHSVYEHGIACYALGETYSFAKLGKRQMPNLMEDFQRGVMIIIESQQEDGNWAYGEGNKGEYDYVTKGREDMSVTGWQFQALKAAKHTNLKIKGLEAGIRKASEYLEKKCITPNEPSSGFGQHDKRGQAYGMYTMTGIGVLGLQTLGGGATGRVNRGIKFLVEEIEKDPLDWKKNANLYCWYYNTQALFQKGGDPWNKWNAQFRDQVVKNQNPDGSWAQETGDFNTATCAAAGADAPVYRTCLCTLMLEVYYRYLKVGDRASDTFEIR